MIGTNSGDPWDDEGVDHEDATSDSLSEVLSSSDDEAEIGDVANESMFFTVMNPPGTASVTAMSDGTPVRVDLAPIVAKVTESQLAEEIRVIANLASRHARAGQHVIVSSMMQRMGHDRVPVQSFIEYELGLPSVETVLAEKAEAFAGRYTDEED